jgi:hypothetical protein
MEPIEVIVRYSTNGRITPVELTWKGSTWKIDSTGRRWQDEGGNQHILALLPGDRTVELIYSTNQGLWFIRQIGPSRTAA